MRRYLITKILKELIMHNMYSETIKEAMVRKLTTPGGPTQAMLSRKVGIPNQTLSRWVKEYGSLYGMKNGSKKHEDWTVEEKFKAVVEAKSLEGQELGEYLRRKGIHSTDLERWEQGLLRGLKSCGLGRPRTDPEIVELKKKEKKLRKELRRKDRALAEASALLVLKKKADLIWGEGEDEESD